MCLEPQAVEQLVGADGLEKLVLFVENREFMDIHTHALETLARCLVNEGILTQFHESGQMSRLVIGKRLKITSKLQNFKLQKVIILDGIESD